MNKKEISRLKSLDCRILDLYNEIKKTDKNSKNYQYKIRLLNDYVNRSNIDRILYKLYKEVNK